MPDSIQLVDAIRSADSIPRVEGFESPIRFEFGFSI